MTPERARAYTSLMKVIASAPGGLGEHEQANLRVAADDLLFTRGAEIELEAREVFNEARALAFALARAGRWPLPYAHQVVTSLEACGPSVSAGVQDANPGARVGLPGRGLDHAQTLD